MRPRITQTFVVVIVMACACMMRTHAAEALPTNVEIDVSFVSFELKDIEIIARETVGAAPTQAQIRKAWMAGKGKLLATNKVIGRSGEKIKTEGVLEKIYPTEYQPPMGGDGATVPSYYYDPHPTPGGFTTRIIGCVVSLVPVIDEAQTCINLMMTPELTKFLGWNRVEVGQDEGQKKVTAWFLQPDVQAQKVTTNLILPIGETIVTGGLPDSTAKELTYLFITARKGGLSR